MKTALDDLQCLVSAGSGDPADEPILSTNAAGPPSLQPLLQGFGLSPPPERVAAALLDKLVEAPQRLRVIVDPVLVILPALV